MAKIKNLQPRLRALQKKHLRMSDKIDACQDNPGHCTITLATMKRKKLLYKDQITALEREIAEAVKPPAPELSVVEPVGPVVSVGNQGQRDAA